MPSDPANQPARDTSDGDGARALEWVIRLFLVALTVTAVWTVFGDELGQLLGR
jgi:hypothetical protein